VADDVISEGLLALLLDQSLALAAALFITYGWNRTDNGWRARMLSAYGLNSTSPQCNSARGVERARRWTQRFRPDSDQRPQIVCLAGRLRSLLPTRYLLRTVHAMAGKRLVCTRVRLVTPVTR